MRLRKYLLNNQAVVTLVLINLVVYILLNAFPGLSGVFLLDPDLSMVMEKPWTVVTVFFSHEIHIHVLLNMLLVLVFGTQLVRETHAKVIYFIYILCGLIGSWTILGYTSFVEYTGGPIAGASAASFGIVAAYAAIRPDTVILRSKSKYWLIALFIVNAVLTIQNPSVSVGGPAHAAGIVLGFIIGRLLLRKLKPLKNAGQSSPDDKSMQEDRRETVSK
ncbi:rhomboid family intramembrane serine protease [Proteiniclasticum sp. C24MP]|uniref:rhomboid family intramembrane serine protease n=1 Tax=Proteiniclasticum sp. C24MP TaxID=3374101 RepID=UPI003753E962